MFFQFCLAHFSPCYRLKYWIGSDPPLCFRVLKKSKISVAQLALLSWSFWRMEKMAMSRYSYIFMAVMTYWVRCAWLKYLLNVLMSLSPVMWLRQMTHLLPDLLYSGMHITKHQNVPLPYCSKKFSDSPHLILPPVLVKYASKDCCCIFVDHFMCTHAQTHTQIHIYFSCWFWNPPQWLTRCLDFFLFLADGKLLKFFKYPAYTNFCKRINITLVQVKTVDSKISEKRILTSELIDFIQLKLAAMKM